MVTYGSGLVDTMVSTLLTWLEDLILKVTGPDFNHKGNQPYGRHLMVANHQSLYSRKYDLAKLYTDKFCMDLICGVKLFGLRHKLLYD